MLVKKQSPFFGVLRNWYPHLFLNGIKARLVDNLCTASQFLQCHDACHGAVALFDIVSAPRGQFNFCCGYDLLGKRDVDIR